MTPLSCIEQLIRDKTFIYSLIHLFIHYVSNFYYVQGTMSSDCGFICDKQDQALIALPFFQWTFLKQTTCVGLWILFCIPMTLFSLTFQMTLIVLG